MFCKRQREKQIHHFTHCCCPTDYHRKVYSVNAGPEFELLEENKLDKICITTPALADNYLLFRTQNHLVSVSEE